MLNRSAYSKSISFPNPKDKMIFEALQKFCKAHSLAVSTENFCATYGKKAEAANRPNTFNLKPGINNICEF